MTDCPTFVKKWGELFGVGGKIIWQSNKVQTHWLQHTLLYTHTHTHHSNAGEWVLVWGSLWCRSHHYSSWVWEQMISDSPSLNKHTHWSWNFCAGVCVCVCVCAVTSDLCVVMWQRYGWGEVCFWQAICVLHLRPAVREREIPTQREKQQRSARRTHANAATHTHTHTPAQVSSQTVSYLSVSWISQWWSHTQHLV